MMKLQKIRKDRNLSQVQLAALMEVDKTTVHRWEAGKVPIPLKQMQKLSEVLDVDVSHFYPTTVASQRNSAPTSNSATIPLYSPRPSHTPGSFLLDKERFSIPVERPPVLSGMPDGFAIYMPDDRMSPKFERGQVLYVNPFRPPRHGDPVVLITGGNLLHVGLLEKLDEHHATVQYKTLDDNTVHRVDGITTVGLVVGTQLQ